MFITKEIVDKDFKFGYVCKFQYAIKSTAYFLHVFFFRLVRAKDFDRQD